MPSITVTALLAGLAVLIAVFYSPVQHSLTVLGVFRTLRSTPVAAEDIHRIADTIHCEDLHYYKPANLFFTACEDDAATRGHWFPPLGIFHAPEKITGGSLHVIDPETFTSNRLTTPNFDITLVTHGIDIIADPTDEESIYIYAVNHQPNPSYTSDAGSTSNATNKAASRIEIFRHTIGSDTATHIRTVTHPLIRTPNDILAIDPGRFFVTNDHFYRNGFLREIEDLVPAAKWSDLAQVNVDFASQSQGDVKAIVPQGGIHNPNGLGRGTGRQILMTSAASGQLYIIEEGRDQQTVRMDSSIDNPSYFRDPYAIMGKDASGVVLAGLSKASQILKVKKDIRTPLGVIVWHVARDAEGAWVKKVLFEDDGSRISSSSAAVILPIDPAKEGGKKKGWLWITGFLAEAMIAVKIDL